MNPGLVQSVIITNRKDCCGQRLKGVEVRVGHNQVKRTSQNLISKNSLCGKYAGPGSNGETVVINCNPSIEGKYVTIQTIDDKVTVINLAEVEIYGNKISASNRQVTNRAGIIYTFKFGPIDVIHRFPTNKCHFK